jgi:hypothetical protein
MQWDVAVREFDGHKGCLCQLVQGKQGIERIKRKDMILFKNQVRNFFIPSS